MIRPGFLILVGSFALAATSAAAADTVLVCEQTGGSMADKSGEVPNKTFTLSFAQKGSKLSNIAVEDPQLVLNPLGDIPVYSSGSSRDGSFTITKTEPAAPKPLKMAGKVGRDNTLNFTEKSLSLALNLVPSAADGTYDFTFSGSRLIGGSFRAMFEGEGVCRPQALTEE
ncbi:hypothetical protein LY632_08165 [Erythrobacter sp. SDW2]|uniref:hypothetical protein n=1 Tax=Erythrobacter sp. SDW2 TaxID=2907154 RepID=UPI001F2C7BAA|nr:hypothetical protein [Erythrobacter sp. SDW2]UIP05687.1 hypothetical protein LY632_08165 [Erythrobacter sp. SDW2]